YIHNICLKTDYFAKFNRHRSITGYEKFYVHKQHLRFLILVFSNVSSSHRNRAASHLSCCSDPVYSHHVSSHTHSSAFFPAHLSHVFISFHHDLFQSLVYFLQIPCHALDILDPLKIRYHYTSCICKDIRHYQNSSLSRILSASTVVG